VFVCVVLDGMEPTVPPVSVLTAVVSGLIPYMMELPLDPTAFVSYNRTVRDSPLMIWIDSLISSCNVIRSPICAVS